MPSDWGNLIEWELTGCGASSDIPDRATITFYLDNESKIDVKLRDNKLVITSTDRLQIQPRASNQVWITNLLNPRA